MDARAWTANAKKKFLASQTGFLGGIKLNCGSGVSIDDLLRINKTLFQIVLFSTPKPVGGLIPEREHLCIVVICISEFIQNYKT